MLFLLPLSLSAIAPDAADAAPPSGNRAGATVILSEDPGARRFQEEWGYADAVAAGDFIFLSGVVAGLKPGETDLRLAYERAFGNIARSLGRLGCSWGDVVEMTSFHTDLTTQMPAMIEVKRRYVGAPYPAWTAVGVTRLIPNGGLTEIKATALCRAKN
jgi:enamine deaminase RidA (YjgF/YER057c/UK114 family)